MSTLRIAAVNVAVSRPPDPGLLRAAIEARLAGQPWAGPECAVADAVADAVGRERAPAPGATGRTP